MCNTIVIQEKSALSDIVKVSSLTEEIVRRLKHTKQELPDTYRMETLEDIKQKMKVPNAIGIHKYITILLWINN